MRKWIFASNGNGRQFVYLYPFPTNNSTNPMSSFIDITYSDNEKNVGTITKTHTFNKNAIIFVSNVVEGVHGNYATVHTASGNILYVTVAERNFIKNNM